MKKKFTLPLLLVFPFCNSFGQQKDSLFDKTQPLDISLALSVKEIKKTKGDTIYLSHKLYYRNSEGNFDSIPVGLKGRGNSRMELCYFPPLWIKIGKKDAKGTLFEGNRKLKLVVPCDDSKGSNELILREYLCYKLYELVTPYSFKTRLVNINLTEVRKKKSTNHSQKGFLIEDVDKTAKRFDAKPLKEEKFHPVALHDTTALRFDLFQFMIANTDWAKGNQHNSKLIYQKPNIIPIPYDFDMSGLVDAHYAVVSQINGTQLPIESVTERYYRGHCQTAELTDFVRKEFISNEEKFLAVPDEVRGELPDREIQDIKDYLEDFFRILKDDNLFEKNILDNCRSID